MLEPVSVVVTCYNLERYIEAAVQSVLDQTYMGEIQVVVVDDRSIDGSREVLARFPGVHRIELAANGGVMQAMIAGLRACQHDVVFFLDGDDRWSPNKVARAMDVFGPDVKFCTHDLWYMDERSHTLPRSSRVSEVLSDAHQSEHHNLIAECLLHHLDYVWLGSAFGVRRSLGAVDSFLEFCTKRDYLQTCYQDWPLAVWVATARGGRMAYIDEKLFGYRIHSDNYSGAAQTLEKRQRNLKKSLDTSRLILEIISGRGSDPLILDGTSALCMNYQVQLSCAEESRWRMLRSAAANWKGLIYSGSQLSNFLRLAMFVILGGRTANATLRAAHHARLSLRSWGM
jgi:glycosyltransferase involved in cell wall biosynthesis